MRGRSAIAVLGSECCHWRTDEHAASSDEEVVSAALPSMAMCPDGGLLMLGSSVYRKRGFMYRKFKQQRPWRRWWNESVASRKTTIICGRKWLGNTNHVLD